jgi:hypothetical protein
MKNHHLVVIFDSAGWGNERSGEAGIILAMTAYAAQRPAKDCPLFFFFEKRKFLFL